jgi:hypothetical protein
MEWSWIFLQTYILGDDFYPCEYPVITPYKDRILFVSQQGDNKNGGSTTDCIENIVYM